MFNNIACRTLFSILLLLDFLCLFTTANSNVMRIPGGLCQAWGYACLIDWGILGLALYIYVRYLLSLLQRVFTVASSIAAFLSLATLHAIQEHYEICLSLRHGL